MRAPTPFTRPVGYSGRAHCAVAAAPMALLAVIACWRHNMIGTAIRHVHIIMGGGGGKGLEEFLFEEGGYYNYTPVLPFLLRS